MAESFDYSGLQATALRLITRFGKTIQVVPKGALIEPARPYRGSADGTPVETVGAFVEFSIEDRAASDSIMQKDRQLLIPDFPAFDLDPENVIEINELTGPGGTVNGGPWKVVDVVDHVRPGDDTVLWILQVRI